MKLMQDPKRIKILPGILSYNVCKNCAVHNALISKFSLPFFTVSLLRLCSRRNAVHQPSECVSLSMYNFCFSSFSAIFNKIFYGIWKFHANVSFFVVTQCTQFCRENCIVNDYTHINSYCLLLLSCEIKQSIFSQVIG